MDWSARGTKHKAWYFLLWFESEIHFILLLLYWFCPEIPKAYLHIPKSELSLTITIIVLITFALRDFCVLSFLHSLLNYSLLVVVTVIIICCWVGGMHTAHLYVGSLAWFKRVPTLGCHLDVIYYLSSVDSLSVSGMYFVRSDVSKWKEGAPHRQE